MPEVGSGSTESKGITYSFGIKAAEFINTPPSVVQLFSNNSSAFPSGVVACIPGYLSEGGYSLSSVSIICLESRYTSLPMDKRGIRLYDTPRALRSGRGRADGWMQDV